VLGATGWLRLDYPLAPALPQESHIFVGDEQSYGGFDTSTLTPSTLQGERFSRYLLGDDVPTWPIETALSTLRIVDALFRSARSNQWEFVS
jgi:hypothetical protein